MNLNYFTEDLKLKMMCVQGRVYSHLHDFIEIVYFDSGNGWHNINGVVYNVCPGDIFLLKRNINHCYYTSSTSVEYSGFSVYNCIFDESFFEDIKLDNVNDFIKEFTLKTMGKRIDSQDGFFYATNSKSFSFKTLMQSMYSEYIVKKSGYKSVIKAKLVELLIEIFRRMEVNSSNIENHTRQQVVGQIKNVIDESATAHISVAEIADAIGFSLSHINKFFKESEGITIKKYILNAKTKRIENLLRESNSPIETIMETLEIYDKKRFYERFKREHGCTPKKYREMYRAAKEQEKNR